MDFKGKVALITGAGNGIGRATAVGFASRGAKVVVVDHDKAAGEATAGILRQQGGDSLFIAADVTKSNDVQNYVKATLDAYGQIDCFHNNAGIEGAIAMTAEYDEDMFDKIMSVNVKGVFLGLRHVLPVMIKQGRGGKVVLISSARSVRGHPAGYGGYCTSKAAIDGLTRTLGCEWGKYKINVNAIGPTVFRSPLTNWMFGDDEKATTVRNGFMARLPLGRLGEPEDLVGVLLFLSSSASDFCTGQTMFVDGGYTAG